ncbi:hypothetical protein TNCV_3284681 [Trichonephila clavipes]|nr:hypothetical protein TNCV_3284681 [Trichonephila clavipes]
MATPGSSFTPTPLGYKDNLGVRSDQSPNSRPSRTGSYCYMPDNGREDLSGVNVDSVEARRAEELASHRDKDYQPYYV